MKYGEITKRLLDYVEIANGSHPHISKRNDFYPSWTELNNEYRDISGGSNSFSHHLPNLRNENTERKCGRYLKKIEGFPSKFEGKYIVKYRKVHPRLEGLRKLMVRILKTFRQVKVDGLNDTWQRVNKDRENIQYMIRTCRGDYNYPVTKDNLIEYNNLYRKYART